MHGWMYQHAVSYIAGPRVSQPMHVTRALRLRHGLLELWVAKRSPQGIAARGGGAPTRCATASGGRCRGLGIRRALISKAGLRGVPGAARAVRAWRRCGTRCGRARASPWTAATLTRRSAQTSSPRPRRRDARCAGWLSVWRLEQCGLSVTPAAICSAGAQTAARMTRECRLACITPSQAAPSLTSPAESVTDHLACPKPQRSLRADHGVGSPD